jgi:5'-nucleotidase
MDLTGAQLNAMLEQQFFPRGSRSQLVLGISEGLTFDWLQSAPQGSRVANVQYLGSPVLDTDVFRIATNNFLADGGDGFTVFRDGTNRISGVLDSSGEVVDDLDALVNYIAANSPLSSPGTNRINEITT